MQNKVLVGRAGFNRAFFLLTISVLCCTTSWLKVSIPRSAPHTLFEFRMAPEAAMVKLSTIKQQDIIRNMLSAIKTQSMHTNYQCLLKKNLYDNLSTKYNKVYLFVKQYHQLMRISIVSGSLFIIIYLEANGTNATLPWLRGSEDT